MMNRAQPTSHMTCFSIHLLPISLYPFLGIRRRLSTMALDGTAQTKSLKLHISEGKPMPLMPAFSNVFMKTFFFLAAIRRMNVPGLKDGLSSVISFGVGSIQSFSTRESICKVPADSAS